MLGGLWFSKDKPTMMTYLMPLMKKFNALYEAGELSCFNIVSTKL